LITSQPLHTRKGRKEGEGRKEGKGGNGRKNPL